MNCSRKNIIWRFVTTPTSPPFKNVMNIFYLSFCFTACKLTPLLSCSLQSLCNWKEREIACIPTLGNQSIIYFLWTIAKFNWYIPNHWLFAKYVLFVFSLLHVNSLNKHTLFSLICRFLLLKILNCNAVVSRGTHINNRYC